MGKNTKTGVSTKRKHSVNSISCDEPRSHDLHGGRNKRQRIASNTVVNNAITKPKERKLNVNTGQKMLSKDSGGKKSHEKSGFHDSSDDLLPLSEIVKRKREKFNKEKSLKTVGDKKGKFVEKRNKASDLVEKVEIVKNITKMKKDTCIETTELSSIEHICETKKSNLRHSCAQKINRSKCDQIDKKGSPSKFKEKVKMREERVVENEKCSPNKRVVTEIGKDLCDDSEHHSSESQPKKKTYMSSIESDDEDSEMDWEDVAEFAEEMKETVEESVNDDIPSTSNNIEVTINVSGKKSKCGQLTKEDIHKHIMRRINRRKKEGQILAHQVHLLSLLSRGLKTNTMCNNSIVQAVGLSLVPEIFTQRRDIKKWDIPFLTRITTWMKNKAPYPGELHTGNSEATYLMRVLEKKIYFFIAILRVLGLSARLILSLQVLSLKVDDNCSKGKKIDEKKRKTPAKNNKTSGKVTTTQKQSVKQEETKETQKKSLSNKLKERSAPSKYRKSERKKSEVDYKEETMSDYFSDMKATSRNSSCNSFTDLDDDDEDDFDETPPKTPKRGRALKQSKSERAGHVDHTVRDEPASGESSGIPKKGCDIWIEVYIEKEKRWICIDGQLSSVNQSEVCERLATKPIKYVMGFDNEGSIKDVTCRYATNWMTTTRKQRVDADWLDETLNGYRSGNTKRDKKEDSLLKAHLYQKPLPQTVSEYKNHPLYVLKRHLLKFEALYPESAATLGFCRGEAVYARDCVHTLHTREIWMKEARVVKSGEQAYKIVKGRKSRRKMLENVGEVKAELFGRWQTEDYIPPPVVNGVVPRNEYGNVELFKPSMLPAGACHIQVPGIHRLARKLKIDAVPAVTGFDFHGGFNHPIIDGVVVGEEFKEQLLLAWDKEQQEKIARANAKREKRVLDNWAHLVRSLRIRERLRRKYNVEEEDEKNVVKQETSEISDELMPDTSLSWPLNKQEGKTARNADGHCHVFLLANNVQDPVTGNWSKVCACGVKEPIETL